MLYFEFVLMGVSGDFAPSPQAEKPKTRDINAV